MQNKEALRIKALNKHGILDNNISDMFDDVTSLATQVCDKAFAMVSFIDADKQWVTSQIGSLPEQIDIDKAFCEHTMQQSDVLEICDTLADERTKHSEFVSSPHNIRYYAGTPLIDAQGHALGTLCVLDVKPSKLSQQQKTILKLLAKDVVSQLALRRKNIELLKLQELHELIIESNPDLIFAKDSEFKIIHANSAFLSLYPQDIRDKVIGYTTLEKYNKEEADAFLEQDRLAFELGKTETIENIVFPSGERRTIFTTKTRFEDDKGKAYILGVARDVTERETLIQLLEKSNADLDEFAYVASHDLKAPLNAIKRLVTWIEEDASDKLDEDSLKHFGMIKNRIDRMNMLLKDLLDYSRIGKNDGLAQALNLQETVKHCHALLDMPKDFIINAQNIDLTLPKLPLELVLTNLMSNAIKHHDKEAGTVTVTCEVLTHGYQIKVSDDGPGIDSSLHEKIFKKFQTIKPRDEVEGSGLGLSMVEKALGNYAGNISVESELGKGATFVIHWPRGKK